MHNFFRHGPFNVIDGILTTPYYHIGFNKVRSINTELLKSQVLLVTVAYNNVLVIKHQIRLLRKNLSDPFHLVIADNSPDLTASTCIETVCKENSVGYIKLPLNPYRHWQPTSLSHGVAINWVIRNYVRRAKPHIYGFLDHDMFPIRRTSLVERLRYQPYYGKKIISNSGSWYLWPGFTLINHDECERLKIKFNFMTDRKNLLDTGGANWRAIFRKHNTSNFKFAACSLFRVGEGEILQRDYVECIDDWVHTFNASYWFDVKSKEGWLDGYLSKF